MLVRHASFLALAALLFGPPCGAAGAPARFYVATNGRDTWSGHLPEANKAGTDGPLASLERARDAVRVLAPKGPVEVILRGGEYTLERTLVLGPEDGGTAEAPVTWRASEGERALIRGGRRVTGWKPWRDGIFVADLKAQGLADADFHQLFYRPAGAKGGFSQRQVLARYPNFDPKHPRTGGFVYNERQMPKPREQLSYEAGAIPFERWKDLSQAEVVSTYNLGWMFAITPILGVDTQARVITVRPVRGQFIKLNRFFVQNVLDALDAPGEWYHDRKEGILYFRPPEGGLDRADVLVPVLDHLIEVRGTIPYAFAYLNTAYQGTREACPLPEDAPPMHPVQHLRFRDLDLECARQDAIRLVGARDCRVTRCRVTNVGNIGINLGGVTSSFPEVGNPRVTPATGRATGGAGGGGQILLLNDPCLGCRVEGCDVWATGCEGILLLGDGNTAENNHVWDIGLYAKDAPCINLLGDGNAARRNTLHDCPRCAIFIKGVENVAELNDVHHTNLETCDMGAIRMVQRNLNLRGNKIRHNRILDTVGYGYKHAQATHYESPFYTWGVYLDDFTCGTEVVGNIIARAGRGGVMIHGGGDNLIANNVIVDAGLYQIEFAPIASKNPAYKDAYAGNRAERNILVCTGENAVPYRFTSAPPHKVAFRGNLIWPGAREPLFITGGMAGVKGLDAWVKWSGEEGARVADPKLLPAQGEHKVRPYLPEPDSPAWKMGFQAIPVAQIGCYASPERVTWPIAPNRERFREKPVLHAVAGYDPASEQTPVVQLAGPVREEYEVDAAGRPPLRGDVAAPPPSAIVVTNEVAAGGRHALKFTDAPGLRQSWMPRLFYPLSFREGTVALSLDLRLDGKQPPELYLDPRDYTSAAGREYVSGPMLTVRPNGDLVAGGEVLARLPFDAWVHLALRIPLGEEESELALTIGRETKQLKVPHAGKGFRHLDRLVIASQTTAASVFYVDNVSIAPAER